MAVYRANVSDNEQFHLEAFNSRGVPYFGFKPKQPFVKGSADEGVKREAIQATAPNVATPTGIEADLDFDLSD